MKCFPCGTRQYRSVCIFYAHESDLICFASHWHEKIEILALTEGTLQVICDDAVISAKRGNCFHQSL